MMLLGGLAVVFISVLAQQFVFMNAPIMGAVPQLVVMALVWLANFLKPIEILSMSILSGWLIDALSSSQSLNNMLMFGMFGVVLFVVSTVRDEPQKKLLSVSVMIYLILVGTVMTSLAYLWPLSAKLAASAMFKFEFITLMVTFVVALGATTIIRTGVSK